MGAPMMPSPMNPTFAISSLLRLSMRISRRRAPRASQVPRAFRTSACTRSQSTLVADRLEVTKQEAVINLAGARLVPTRIVGHLDVPDRAQVRLHRRRELTFHPLCVIDVVLDEQVVRAGRLDELQCLPGPPQVKPGNVEGVDRLDQEPDPCALELLRGEAQVGDEGGIEAFPVTFLARCPLGS